MKEEAKISDRDLIRRLLAFLLPYKYWILLSLTMLLAAKFVEAFVPIYIGKMTQAILSGFSLDDSQKWVLFSNISTASLHIFFLLLLIYILDTSNVYFKNWIGQKGVYALRTKVFRHIQKMPLEYYNKKAVGSLMTRVIHDIDQIDQMFSESIIPLIGSFLLLIFICVGLFFLNWKVALLLAATLPPAYLLTRYFHHHQRRCYDNIRTIVSAMNAFVQEHLMGASIIRSFGLQQQQKAQFDVINKDHFNANVDAIKYFSFFFAGIDFIQSVALIAVFMLLVILAGPSEGFDVGTYFTFSLYAMMLFRPLVDLAERYNVLQSAMAAASRVFQVLDETMEDYKKPPEEPELAEITRIEFEDVWFAYKDENWVLKGFSLVIEKGQTVAIVGVTGSGKTTLLNLLLRFYRIQKGAVKLNGIDINRFSLETIRKHFSVILQDPEIFSGTIFDNITMYDQQMTEKRVEKAIDYVNLRPVIAHLPEGVNTYLAERGKSLSAGEQQLVSLARAVALDANVFILDEATANIDSGTEAIIKNILQKIFANKTALVIAHRLSTIKGADKIVVMLQGRAAEVGTHEELLKLKGIYEKLYRLQYMDKQK